MVNYSICRTWCYEVAFSERPIPSLQHMVDVPQPVVGTTPKHVLYRIVQNLDFALLARRECGEDGAAEIRPPLELELVPSEGKGGRMGDKRRKKNE